MPRDLKTIPTTQLKTEAKLYLLSGAGLLGLAVGAIALKSLLGEGLGLGLFLGGLLLGMLLSSIGVGFSAAAIFRPKDWKPTYDLGGWKPDPALSRWIRDLGAELPGWAPDHPAWESVEALPQSALWSEGIKGMIQRFTSLNGPLVLVYLLRVRLVHRSGRTIACHKAIGRPRDLCVARIGGLWLESAVSGSLTGPVRYSSQRDWDDPKRSLSRFPTGFKNSLQERLDGLFSTGFDGVSIPFAFVDLIPQDGQVQVMLHTLPRQTHGGFGSNPVVAEFVQLLEFLEPTLAQSGSAEGPT